MFGSPCIIFSRHLRLFMLNMVGLMKYLLGNVKAVELSAVRKRIQFRVKLTIVNLDTVQWVDVFYFRSTDLKSTYITIKVILTLYCSFVPNICISNSNKKEVTLMCSYFNVKPPDHKFRWTQNLHVLQANPYFQWTSILMEQSLQLVDKVCWSLL